MMQRNKFFFALTAKRKVLKFFITWFTFIAILFIWSCKKTKVSNCPYSVSTVVAPSAQTDSLQTLLTDSGIVATKSTAGFFYTINKHGTGTYLTNICQNINVTYKASFFNGKKLDSTMTGRVANFQLGAVILGWQKGLPFIASGGDITLFLPPALGYGSTDVGDDMGHVIIPANSYLIFRIQLVSVQ